MSDLIRLNPRPGKEFVENCVWKIREITLNISLFENWRRFYYFVNDKKMILFQTDRPDSKSEGLSDVTSASPHFTDDCHGRPGCKTKTKTT